ncbi:disease resistance protein At4g27190-like [Mangifera indica]|uniref:disease resistance protein At4g27190-like n=1 Tax=Mangifera indica TaxID=29780 RepID=UPI001CFA7FD0|nr:disease resistance protein At4g27190-like [Mangifera indica]
MESDSSSAPQFCTDLIGNWFSYLHNYKTNFENLKAHVEKLSLVKQRVLHMIEVARRNGEEVDMDVQEWLISVNKFINEANTIIEDESKGKKKCFGGLCPNLGTRHQLSKKAVNEVKAIVLLLSQGEKFHEISSRTIPEEISSLITSSQNLFLSLRNYKRYYEKLVVEVEKLMDNKERVQRRMEVSRRNGEAIYEDVLKWVMSVGELVDDTRRTFEGFKQKGNSRCFIGLCPDLRARYHLSNKAVRQLKAVAELRGEGVFDKVSYTIIPPNIWLTSTKVYQNFGSRSSTLQGLYSSLNDPNIDIVGVYGMGGIGKTVLVKQVAARAETEKLFDVVIFAEVTSKPNIKKIQGDIADHLGLLFRQEDEVGRAIRLFDRLKKEKNVLVILDDIWTTLDLRRVGIPVGYEQEGCKVLLTSRYHDILRRMGSQHNFAVSVLDEEEGFSLFRKIAGESAENQELQSFTIEIAMACGGLPLAIASIAITLRGKGISTWKNALRNLRRPSSNNFTGMLADVYTSIRLSYDDLKSLELKSTFLLCSLMIYSGDASVMELLKYGMGLGLFKEISSVEEARNRVYALIHELKCCCLLLDGHSSEWFSMHDMVRLVAISIASRDQHALTLTNGTTDWLDKDALRRCQVIFICDSNNRELPEGLECPQLTFFNLLVQNSIMKTPDSFFSGMTQLTVLNLTKMHLSPLPFSLCLLVKLRTLCLDQCILGNITGIGNLKNLEILSLSHSDIKFLPKDIGQLTRLRMLDMSDCSKLEVISPNVISSLSCLEELYMSNSFLHWEVEGLSFEGRNASLNELKHLSELTSLEICIKDANILPRDLVSKLIRYRIFIGDGWDWFREYGTLRTLKLKGNTSKRGITRHLNGIEELYLDELLDVDNVLYQLNLTGFLQLKHLHVQNISSLLCIVDPTDKEPGHAFPHLESLLLHNLINLETIFKGQFTEESFCNLKIIKVEKCDRLKYVFSFSLNRQLQRFRALEPGHAFPYLESLYLHNLLNLEMIFRGQFSDKSFCNLKIIKVEKCDKLKNIFSLSIARGLPQLQTLEFNECNNMEHIFFPETIADIYVDDSEEDINKEVVNKIEFGHIHSLTLKSLPKLRSSCLKVTLFDEVVLEEVVDSNTPLFSERVLFPMLQVLELAEINIKKIWHNQLPSKSSSIQNLTHLILQGCGKLNYIFSSSILRSFVNLEHLEICHCEILEVVIFMDEFCEEVSKENFFPCLECLVMKDLEKLTRFCSENYVEFPSLKKLEIEQCPQFKSFVLTNINTDSEEIQPFFTEKVVLPSLKEMIISGMDNLKVLWKKVFWHSFHKLKLMEIKNCDKLLTVFPLDMFEKFQQLETLTVTACGSLVEIFDLRTPYLQARLKELYIHGLPKLRHIWKTKPQIGLSFPKLCLVKVLECQNLENVFPASIARSLFELEELEIVNCGVKEIVSKEERGESTVRFVFPRITFLKFSMLPQLRCFYPGTHTSEWMALKKLEVCDCDNVEIFISKFLSNQLDVPAKQPLFLVEKVIPNLEELKLGGKVVAMIWQRAFPELLFRRVEVLLIVRDELDVLPFHAFQRFQNLEKLILNRGSYEEIFLDDEVDGQNGQASISTQIRELKLFDLSNLKFMWKQESKLSTLLQNLVILDVWWCHNLIYLVPSSACFYNLTVLELWFCKKLKNLVALSTAKTLVHLKEMKIGGCEMMIEVVANEGYVIKEVEINFCKLKSLTLFGLESLRSFCSGDYTFIFPLLEELFVIECPNMTFFSGGVLSTPILQAVQQSWAADVWRWDGDLNTTIWQLQKKMKGCA